jgi:hypothetical protein
MTPYDFDYDANVFPTHHDMFICMRNFISLSRDHFTEICGPGYNALYWSNSVLNETIEEVHLREIKRFIRSGILTRNHAMESLIQIVCTGSLYTTSAPISPTVCSLTVIIMATELWRMK